MNAMDFFLAHVALNTFKFDPNKRRYLKEY